LLSFDVALQRIRHLFWTVTRGFERFSTSGWYPAMTNRTDANPQLLC
jgi:hypothetical protein